MTIKGRLLSSRPMLKSPFLGPISTECRRNGAQKWRFFEDMGIETPDFGFATPKRHVFARNHVVWRILRQNLWTRLGCSLSQTPPQKKNSRVTRGAKSRMDRTETPTPIWIKFCTVVNIPDVVTYTNFGDHRLRGFWAAGVKFPPLPLTFIVALTTLSHYLYDEPPLLWCDIV